MTNVISVKRNIISFCRCVLNLTQDWKWLRLRWSPCFSNPFRGYDRRV